MKVTYYLISHYIDSEAIICSFDSFEDAYYQFEEVQYHMDLAFALLYLKTPTDTRYKVLNCYVNQNNRNAYEFVFLGFDKPKTPAGQE